MILLDSDVLVEILDKTSTRGEESITKILESGETVATTSITIHEVAYGLEKHGKPTKAVAALSSLPFDLEAALLSARIEAELEKAGEQVQRTDTMIAAVAVKAGAKLHTYNLRHFERMKRFGLILFS